MNQRPREPASREPASLPLPWLQMSQGAEEARGSRLRKIQGHDVQGGDATPDLPAGAVLEEARRGGPQSASPPSGFGPTRARQYGVL